MQDKQTVISEMSIENTGDVNKRSDVATNCQDEEWNIHILAKFLGSSYSVHIFFYSLYVHIAQHKFKNSFNFQSFVTFALNKQSPWSAVKINISFDFIMRYYFFDSIPSCAVLKIQYLESSYNSMIVLNNAQWN